MQAKILKSPTSAPTKLTPNFSQSPNNLLLNTFTHPSNPINRLNNRKPHSYRLKNRNKWDLKSQQPTLKCVHTPAKFPKQTEKPHNLTHASYKPKNRNKWDLKSQQPTPKHIHTPAKSHKQAEQPQNLTYSS